ncbi:MAG TPA: 6-phosphofructokinase [Bacteroidales bacterium]|nr:6-phosphofructokinase [Bacteroidales bacterium]
MRAINTIGVLTSGSDAPGMNAAIRSVVRTATYMNKKIIGIYQGFDGLIEGNFVEMDNHSVSNIIQRGGTVLKSTKSERFKTREGIKKAYENIVTKGIDGLIVIGGDGTFRGATALISNYNINIVGIPATIDNDLYGTDYTIGYNTALNTIIEAIDKLRDTASSHKYLFFVEVMGGDSGFIAMESGIAVGAEAIIMPGEKITIQDIIEQIEQGRQKNKPSGIIIVSENSNCGGAYEVANKIKEQYKHYEIKIAVIGHLQRGGSPCCYDRVLASKLGYYAVYNLVRGASNIMVGIKNNKIVKVPIIKAIKQNPEINPEMFEIAKILSL